MKVREGLIPTALGTIVTAAGLAMKPIAPQLSWGVSGFGLAHMLLGAIDLVGHRRKTGVW
jgi:hypothetical protein